MTLPAVMFPGFSPLFGAATVTQFQGFRFFTTNWTLAVSLVLVALTACICFVAWRRSGYATLQGLLELLRFGIVSLVAILLNQPEWVQEYRPTEKPTIAVLHDASPSMDTKDVLLTGTVPGAGVPQTRREAAAPLIADDFWKPLANRFTVEVAEFSPADASGSDYAEPLGTAVDRFSQLQAIVLVGDGDWNKGDAPSDAAQRLRLANVPVLTVTVGSPTKLPDIELKSLDIPSVGVAGKAVRVPFTIESSLPTEKVVTVELKPSKGPVVQKQVRLPPLSTVSESMFWTPDGFGEYTVVVSVAAQEGELLPDNNRLSAPIAIRKEQLQVLVVESIPRWEYRYLRNALSRDPGVNVSCLLFQPGLGRRGGGNKDYIQKFPAKLEDLSKYDVVFLGDVGVNANQLSEADCRLLKGLVEYQASGLVFIPGWLGEQSSLVGTALEELCPVVIDPVRREGFSTEAARRLVLTEAGRKSLLTKLADNPNENLAVWDSLPGVQWYGPVVRAKAGAEVLAVHEDASNEYGRVPLLITKPFGAGKVLYMATDGAWRWRKGVEDKYHYRFWSQVVRWMAYRRNMAKGERMGLSFAPEQPQLGQSLALDARVSQANGEPLSRGEVAARITSPSGVVETVRFTPPAGETGWGVFASTFTPREPGKHEVLLGCKETGDTLEASFFVQGKTAEGIGRAARPNVLAEIAQVTRGKVVPPEDVASIIESLAKLPEPAPRVRRLQLWCHPVVAISLVGLLGLFWVLRKQQGLI